ncbi:MAG: hypothetical protein ACLVIR_12860 [Clostridium sp.]
MSICSCQPIQERDYVQSDRRTIEAFQHYLESQKITRLRCAGNGKDINGACVGCGKAWMKKKEAEDR